MQQHSQDDLFRYDCKPLAQPLTDEERLENWSYLSKLHPANRLRLMFGQPFLAETSGGSFPKLFIKSFDDVEDTDL